jgi:hypothetical protein
MNDRSAPPMDPNTSEATFKHKRDECVQVVLKP